MTIIVDLLTVAKKLNNYEIDATGATALWPDTTHYHVQVPAGKRWFLLGGFIKRNVSSVVTVQCFNAADKCIAYLAYGAAATTSFGYPISDYIGNAQIVLDAGEYVQCLFGTAQDASTYASCIVLEIDV